MLPEKPKQAPRIVGPILTSEPLAPQKKVIFFCLKHKLLDHPQTWISCFAHVQVPKMVGNSPKRTRRLCKGSPPKTASLHYKVQEASIFWYLNFCEFTIFLHHPGGVGHKCHMVLRCVFSESTWPKPRGREIFPIQQSRLPERGTKNH